MKIDLYPDPSALMRLPDDEGDGPVVMLNLLKFREKATSPDEGVSGFEAYARYGRPMVEFVRSRGGRVVWQGRVSRWLIGESDVEFEVVALVEYPSRRAFLEIAMSPEVQEIAVHRAAGLEGQWLVALDPVESV